MSRFAERLAAAEFAVSLEISPPKKRLDDVLLHRARLLGGRADTVNVIQRPDRLPSLDTCAPWSPDALETRRDAVRMVGLVRVSQRVRGILLVQSRGSQALVQQR